MEERIRTLVERNSETLQDPRELGESMEAALQNEGVKRSAEGVAIVDSTGILVYVNATFSQQHGCNPADLIGRHLKHFISSARESFFEQMLLAAQHEEFLSQPTTHRMQDGTERQLFTSIFAVPTREDLPGHYVVITRETPKERLNQMESEPMAVSMMLDRMDVEAGRKLLYDLVEAAPQAILLASARGIVEYANQTALALLDNPPEQLLARHLGDFFPETDRAQLNQYVQDPAQEAYCSGEMKHAWKDGTDHYLKFLVRRISVLGMADPLLAVYMQDVSELNVLKSHLQHSQKLEAIGLLASGLAHNINSPLAAVIMTTEMAQAKHPEVKEFDDILQASARIGEIVTNLMTKSRQEQTLTEVEIDLNQLVRTELKFLEANLFFKHSVNLSLDLQEQLPKIRGLYGDFSQIFHNLIQNALDAMESPEGNELEVKTRFHEEKGKIALCIRDSGCGIPAEHVERLFEPFFTTKSHLEGQEPCRPSGTGLGLHVALQLIEQYGGTIDVESFPGEGSLFTLYIPVRLLYG